MISKVSSRWNGESEAEFFDFTSLNREGEG